MIQPSRIRNFSIISHVDHGKSTLSDRILELTGAVDPRLMRNQFLDSMDIERERGITIKAQNVRVIWKEHILNLIDTPGHVDFTYEVSRSLAACEGAVLLVDASQGIQAQTLATCYQAMEHDLEIVAVLNKIDLPAADTERCSDEIEGVLGIERSSILQVSAKNGNGVVELLDAIVERIPPPTGSPDLPLRALVFDSAYDRYRGVINSIRIMNGVMRSSGAIMAMQVGKTHEVEELGVRTPDPLRVEELGPGEVGYVITGVKNLREIRSGETLTYAAHPADEPLAGYREPKPMVFCGLYPMDGDELPLLRESLEKLQLSDASFTFEPESSKALGFGFRCGFLGLLHMDIVRERLEREFSLDIIATAPSVKYIAHLAGGKEAEFDNPSDMPERVRIESIEEPVVRTTLIVPAEYTGTVMELCQSKRADLERMEYLSPERLELVYTIPLAEVVINFFDQLKSRTKGYASLDYEIGGYRVADLVKVDILLNHSPVDAFSTILHKSQAESYGRKMVAQLRELIPRQLFDVPIQAAIGTRVIARETVKARRKDVIAKCYGGDITRKRKLLEQQKEGKKRMKAIGSVEVPQEAFVSVLRLDN
ncbi:MAG: translation elongation factor 4 [Actinobacteria bacterium]|nr:translation elongation factor 4 [Actinomycetota bacterium]MCL5885670.1 translation elongation factor 4 [Actinomycetota bacterium]